MDARTTHPGDAAARRGLMFAIGAIALLPIIVAVVTVVPQGARGAVFELGLLCAAALAIWGGVVARRAVQAGTGRTATAYAGSIVGLVPASRSRWSRSRPGSGSSRERRPAADLRRILGIQAVRAFLYGFGAVILGSSLAPRAPSTWPGRAPRRGDPRRDGDRGDRRRVAGDRLGRRRTYIGLLVLMGVVGLAYALTDRFWILVVLALLGVMSTDANENGPLTTLEQSMIGQAPAETRLHVFGRYNAVAYLAGALGALLAGGPAFVQRFWTGTPTGRAWFLLFPLGAAICLLLARGLSPELETEVAPHAEPARAVAQHGHEARVAVRRRRVRRRVRHHGVHRLLVRTDVRREPGADVGGVLRGRAAPGRLLGDRAPARGAQSGCCNTMVFTHLPSNILLILVPLAPTLAIAIVVLLSRFALSQMDVPTRQAYIAAMVDPAERTAAAAATNSARYVARPFGPLVGTVLMRVAIGAPWVVAGALKSVYDLVLWRVFSKVPLPDSGAD